MKAPVDRKLQIDCHVQLAAFPDGDNGRFISPKMLKSPLFRSLLWKHGLDGNEAAHSNRKYVADGRPIASTVNSEFFKAWKSRPAHFTR